jgi:hypothetical protein
MSFPDLIIITNNLFQSLVEINLKIIHLKKEINLEVVPPSPSLLI